MALSTSEIAKALSFSKSHILNLIKSGEIKTKPRSNPRGKYLIDEAEFIRYQEHATSKDKSGREYVYFLLNQYINQLPDSFDQHNRELVLRNLSSELTSLSQALRTQEHPYYYWATMLSEISQNLNSLLASETFRMLLHNDTMQLLGLLKDHQRNSIQKLRESLKSRQEPLISQEIISFRDRIQEWSDLCLVWESFRDEATKCFITPRLNEKYKELNKSSIVVYDKQQNRNYIWNSFGLVVHPIVIASMARWYSRLVEHLNWEFDTICSLSTAALPFSSFIGQHMRKNVVSIDNEKYLFQPTSLPGMNYIYVDTICQTGSHLLKSINLLSKHRKNTIGAIFITLNDMMLEEKRIQQYQIINDMINQKQLLYCFDISYLYRRFLLSKNNPFSQE